MYIQIDSNVKYDCFRANEFRIHPLKMVRQVEFKMAANYVGFYIFSIVIFLYGSHIVQISVNTIRIGS